MSMWSLSSVSSVFIRFRSCCACIAACVFFSIIRFFSSSRCRISSTCTHVITHNPGHRTLSGERRGKRVGVGDARTYSIRRIAREAFCTRRENSTATSPATTSRMKERDEGTVGGGGEASHDLVSCTSLAFPFPYNHLPVKSIFPSFNPVRTILPPLLCVSHRVYRCIYRCIYRGAVFDCSLGNLNGTTSLLGDYGGSFNFPGL